MNRRGAETQRRFVVAASLKALSSRTNVMPAWTQVNRIMQDTYMDVSGRTTHMYSKYGIRVTQDAVTEESKSSICREIFTAK